MNFNSEEQKILQSLIDRLGKPRQLAKFREEAIEALLALERYLSPKNNDVVSTINHLAEEIADTMITAEQVRMIIKSLHKNNDLVEIWKDKKMARLAIENEKFEAKD